MTRNYLDRLVKHLDFLKEELNDYKQFIDLTHDDYIKNRDKRRNVERWIENVISSTIDISRGILNIEGKSIPDTYREIVSMISVIDGLENLNAERISKWVKLRNVIALDYLDIKWDSINKFIKEAEPLYMEFTRIIEQYTRNKIKIEK